MDDSSCKTVLNKERKRDVLHNNSNGYAIDYILDKNGMRRKTDSNKYPIL